MKKILSISTIAVFLLSNIAFAFTETEVKNRLEITYTTLNTNLVSTYNKYLSKYKNVENTTKTWDYVYLAEITGLDLSWLKNNITKKYSDLSSEIVSKKYDLLSQVDDAKNKLDTNLISTGDYETTLENIVAEISGYNTTYTNKIKLLDDTLSWNIADFNKNLENKLNTLKADVEKLKNIDLKIKKLEDTVNTINNKKKELEKIVGISNEVVSEKSEEIKNYINNYFSWYVEKQYENYVKQDGNFAYFSWQKEIKKQLILGYISDKISNTIKNVINSYFPNIDFDSLNKTLEDIKSTSLESRISDYQNVLKNIEDYQTSLDTANSELDKYLSKFGENPKKEDILNLLKQDILTSLEEASKIVQDDIKQTFKSYMDFVKVKEASEQQLVNVVSKTYEEKINTTNIDELKSLISTLNTYKDSLSLPLNKQYVSSLIEIANKKLIELKNKAILEQISNISNQIDNLPIWNNFDLISNLETKIEALSVPDNFKNKVEILKLKLKMKENLFKLFDAGAIKYYYRIWDLTNRVNNILKSYYNKYKKAWKTSKFEEKLQKALDKLAIIEDNLDSSKRSYYIIMVHNGILKYQIDNLMSK